MAETKLLDFNMDKYCVIVIGKKSARSKLKKELEQNPPLLYGQNKKQVDAEKYLGDRRHYHGARNMGDGRHPVFNK